MLKWENFGRFVAYLDQNKTIGATDRDALTDVKLNHMLAAQEYIIRVSYIFQVFRFVAASA